MKYQLVVLSISLFTLASCSPDPVIQDGPWRAWLQPDSSNPELVVPFNMTWKTNDVGSLQATISNADERIIIEEIRQNGDSLFIQLPVFQSHIEAHIKRGILNGAYTHDAAGSSWTIPFYAKAGDTNRFDVPIQKPLFSVDGAWKVTVNPSSTHPEIQIGEFVQSGNHLTGTFLTVVGDYRYLEGLVSGNQFMLSCFDGAHSLVFKARLSAKGTLEDGIFSGGPNWKGTWRAEKDPNIQLPDPEGLTFIKPGYSGLSFSFPDLDGKPVSLDDPRFENKAVIVQIIGSWCPNCMDETRYFADLYRRYKDQGLEIIALCYESANINESIQAIKRFKAHTGAEYTFLHAGESNKRKAAQTLPMLNRILSFPTSIFLNRKAEVEGIFTGFSGPGTGKHFEELSLEMEDQIRKCLE